MNIGTSECVKSKYFAGNGMDESLEDFQESKKAPKAPQKPKPKARKAPKRIKGQRDIRKVVNAKKNELEKYSKEFDTVCKKSGIDIDSEQLQLAIALSKSLQSGESSEPQPSQSSTQNRLAKIRTTLKEYGFKVPEATKTTNKRVKKTRKQYRLINITEEERRQIIIEKYSQVLLQNEDSSQIDSNAIVTNSKKQIYDIATSLPYEYMQDNTLFYTDIIEKSTTNGILLRDWADIPGRPASPKLEIYNMNISEIPCSQDELDVVLSGTIIAAKNIINNKTGNIKKPEIVVIDLEEKENTDNVNRIEISSINIKIINVDIESNDTEKNNKLAVSHPHISASPDLFDDEPSCNLETSTSAILSQNQKTKAIENDFMDLTECTNINPSAKVFEQTQSQCSGKTYSQSLQSSQNVTKRKSNDLMEITECVTRFTQNENEVKEIDLTQPETGKNINYKGNTENKDIDVQNDTLFDEIRTSVNANNNVDLTQSSNEENANPDTEKQKDEEINKECMDLTQSTNSSVDVNDLSAIMISNTSNLDNTVILNEDEYLENGKVKSIIAGNLAQEVYDLTQIDNKSSSIHSDKNSLKEASFFDEFVHNHSNSSGGGLEQNNVSNKENDENVGIDLTQSSDEDNISQHQAVPNNSSLGKKDDISIDYDEVYQDVSIESIVNETSQLSQSRSKEFSNKVNSNKDISISQQYDDVELPNTSRNSGIICMYEEMDGPNISSLSQNSEVFDISDTELNYSLHKSRLEMPRSVDLGGISVINNITMAGHLNDLPVTSNKTIEDSFLPEVYVKSKDEVEVNNVRHTSPIQNHVENTIKTPKNSDVIVKTSDVTPMIDYASMSTPQRNNELDKYGLKPFKRKRAIQILTHLYNQTHPLVKNFPEDQPSPKKQKQDDKPNTPQVQTLQNQPSTSINDTELNNRKMDPCVTPKKSEQFKSPKKSGQLKSPIKSGQLKSPKKCVSKMATKSPRKEYACSYEISSAVPVIRNLDCSSDDWVFQKREKAKIHSCRVPLHIAFHNYVASRSSLMEAILNYEPVNIDVIHKDLVSYGHRYDPKDLLKFLDKKCITVKTADNNSRNSKR